MKLNKVIKFREDNVCGFSEKQFNLFMDKINIPTYKNEDVDITACWTWNASKNIQGYGRFWHEINGFGSATAHRVMYMLFYNTLVDDGKLIMHKCDNRQCCNPYHLLEGTPKSNAVDMIFKGRGAKNIKKLGTKKVFDIRFKVYNNPNITRSQIAEEYNIKVDTVTKILNGKSYTDQFREFAYSVGMNFTELVSHLRSPKTPLIHY
jgi:hypothetical protein